MQAIRNVKLDNNPLICDECHMGKLIDVVRQVSKNKIENLQSKIYKLYENVTKS